MNIDRLEYVREIVARATDFDYTDARFCVAGQCHRHFGAGSNESPVVFATAYLELTQAEAGYLFHAADVDGSVSDKVWAGMVTQAMAVDRLDCLIGKVFV
jgi:hypothetical protein